MANLLLVAGTRPEAIKMAPVIEQLRRLQLDFTFVWNGQHYDYKMSKIFFEQLDLPEPDDNLDVKSGSHAQQTAESMVKLEKIIRQYMPSIVVSEGDTNSVAAAAMTSVKCLVPFAHVEAGLRSWNPAMPEEINRKIADSVASLHFAPTKASMLNLLFEGVSRERLHLTGNTIVDVVRKHRDAARELGERIMSELNVEKEKYLLVTIHRAENTDDPSKLENILAALRKLAREFTVVFPVHPRTKERIAQTSLEHPLEGIIGLEPLGYQEFLGLLMNCLIVLTDSGGVQEEACTVKVPTVTLRYNTERPETIPHGNVLAGAETGTIVDAVHKQIDRADEIRKSSLENPFGDGRAGEKIAILLKKYLEEGLEIVEPDLRRTPLVSYRLLQSKHMSQEQWAQALLAFDRFGLPCLTTGTRNQTVRWIVRMHKASPSNTAWSE